MGVVVSTLVVDVAGAIVPHLNEFLRSPDEVEWVALVRLDEKVVLEIFDAF